VRFISAHSWSLLDSPPQTGVARWREGLCHLTRSHHELNSIDLEDSGIRDALMNL
jgi:hypothetical protein